MSDYERLAANFIANVCIPLERKGYGLLPASETSSLLARVLVGQITFGQAKQEYKAKVTSA